MRYLIDRLHDVWCTISRLCRVRPPNDPTADWLDAQRAHSREEIRRLRANPAERQYLGLGQGKESQP